MMRCYDRTKIYVNEMEGMESWHSDQTSICLLEGTLRRRQGKRWREAYIELDGSMNSLLPRGMCAGKR